MLNRLSVRPSQSSAVSHAYILSPYARGEYCTHLYYISMTTLLGMSFSRCGDA